MKAAVLEVIGTETPTRARTLLAAEAQASFSRAGQSLSEQARPFWSEPSMTFHDLSMTFH